MSACARRPAGEEPSPQGDAIAAPPPLRWSRVARAVYDVALHYRYAYSEPIRRLEQRLVVVPPDTHGDQRLLDFAVSAAGAEQEPAVAWGTDRFGNRVCTVRTARVPVAVTFEARYRVQRHGRHDLRSDWLDRVAAPDLAALLEPTRLTTPDERLRDVAHRLRLSSRRPRGRAYRAFHWAAAAITYQVGATTVETTAAEALAGGAGVCQDFTHLLLTVLRLLDIPARYVSGHLLGRGAPHAWVEALFPDESEPDGVRVVAYDPANRAEPGLNYIAVAVGRDYADVTPTSGAFVGRATSELQYRKRAEVVEVEYRAG